MQDRQFPDFPFARPGASDLVAALDAYARASARLAERWPDTDTYEDVRQQIDAIRQHGTAVPPLTVLSLQLVIAHSELVSTLWQHASAPVSASVIHDVRGRHALAIQALRAGIAELLCER